MTGALGTFSCLEVFVALSDRLATPPARRSSPCAVGRILAELSDEDRNTLTAALVDDRFTTTSIHRALRDEGHELSYFTVGLHRRGECCCGPI